MTQGTAAVAQLNEPELSSRGHTFSDWIQVLWFAALIAACYAVVIVRLVQQWTSDDDMSHGMFVPILAGYIVWQRRERLFALPVSSSRWGLVLMVAGAVMLCIGPPSLPTFVFMTRVALMFTLFGVLLYLMGMPLIRELAYPLFLLFFMIPLPGFVFQKITLPLQFVASALSEHILEFMGYSVLREGNILHLPGQTLSVVEACSGLRSLLSLSFLAQLYAYLFDRRVWMRAVVAIAIIPIAVVANAGRIVSSAIAGRINPEWGHGMFHASTGWVVFVIAFIALVVTHYLINAALARFQGRRHVS